MVERPSSGAEPGRSGRDAPGRGGGAAGGTGVMRGKGKRSHIEGSDQRGGRERQQVRRSYLRWRAAIAGGEERPHVELRDDR